MTVVAITHKKVIDLKLINNKKIINKCVRKVGRKGKKTLYDDVIIPDTLICVHRCPRGTQY